MVAVVAEVAVGIVGVGEQGGGNDCSVLLVEIEAVEIWNAEVVVGRVVGEVAGGTVKSAA